MPIVYKTCTSDGNIPDYICDACSDTEKGRVRGAVYIDKSLKSEIIKANVESLAWWETQIEAGLIKIVPTTRGTFDGGTPITVTGYGDENEKTTGKTFVVSVSDMNHFGNKPFYQALENNFKNYLFGFRTEKELRISTDAITALNVQDPVEEDAESVVNWNANVTWRQYKPNMLVPIYALTDEVKKLFSNCIEVEP